MFAKLPRVAIMENVKGLTHKKHRKVLKGMARALTPNFKMYWKVLNAENYQHAQSRERLFCVMIRKDCLKRAFTWPKAVSPKVQLQAILGSATPPAYLPGRSPKGKRVRARAAEVWSEAHPQG